MARSPLASLAGRGAPVKISHRFVAIAGALAAGLVTAGTAAAVSAAPAPAPDSPQARAQAAKAATSMVASRPQVLHAGADDQFIQHSVITSHGIQYVPYDRTYKGLSVVGGDFVLVSRDGQAMSASVAQQQPIGNVSLAPKVAQSAAEATARGQVETVDGVHDTHLVVYALNTAPKLAWETTVTGTNAEGPSRLTVYLDATTGALLSTKEHVLFGDGNSAWNGPKPVHLDTTGSGGTF